MIRRTLRDENIFVLSMFHNGEFFNYEICLKDQILTNKYYFIDDGPYFKTLSHLIEHYSKYEDGLPGLLTKPIQSSTSSSSFKFKQTSSSTGLIIPEMPRSDALTKANLFKSRTLLNDQSILIFIF